MHYFLNLFGAAARRRMSARARAILTILVALLALGSSPAVQAQANLPDFTDIVAQVDAAVVNIRTTATIPVRASGRGDDPYEMFRWFFGPDFMPPGVPQQPQRPPRRSEERVVPRGVGSGFFISTDGYVLTNNHVVSDATDIYVTLTDGREFKAKVIGTDARTDVALIKVDATGMSALSIGDPKTLKKGQWVLAIGSPFGLESTVTAGIVSAVGRDTGEYLSFIQTDVAVNPGNSGGPLLDLSGKVVGINSQIVSRSGGFMGISLAIPIDEAMNVVEQIKKTGRVTRGRIGVQISEVGKDVANAIGLQRAEGALVSGVEAGGPAEEAGIQAGDVILRFGGQTIRRWSDLPRVVGQTRPGISSRVEVWRKGRTMTLTVKVAELEPDAVASADSQESVVVENALGLTVEPIPVDVQKRLRIRGGVRVTQASGPAANADIEPGDLILALNNTDVENPKQFATLISKLDTSRVVGLLVRRGDATRWIAVQPAK